LLGISYSGSAKKRMNILAAVLAVLNLLGVILMGFMLFILKDIKDDLKTNISTVLTHVSNLDIHCSREKFKLNHLIPGE
jgi:hypothetical protein